MQRSNEDSDRPERKKKFVRRRQKGMADIKSNHDVDFLLFIADEEGLRENDPLYKKSDSLFSTFIEPREEFAGDIGMDITLQVSPDEPVTMYDVYVNLDSKYRNVGSYLTLKEAKLAADRYRLNLERTLKDALDVLLGFARR